MSIHGWSRSTIFINSGKTVKEMRNAVRQLGIHVNLVMALLSLSLTRSEIDN